MTRLLGRWLKIYEDEIRLFLWSTALLFLIRSADVIFNNFAETAFLKRFGVEYLPLVYVATSVTTFVVMGLVSGFMARLPGSRLLGYMLVFCGGTVAGFRLLIPFGIDLLYPLLFILKSLYEVLLGLLFWNLANDLFDTRQSKRLFPLITAGGVIGGILGSFGTPVAARLFRIDNLLWAYLIVALAGAVVVRRMDSLFPTLMLPEGRVKKVKKRKSLKQEIREVLPLIRDSALVKILVLLTLVPNLVIPILNYQFNFAVDRSFATEGGMIEFFGYFRGTLNIVSFVILLFVGRVYGRWGVPVALMFHPFNYVVAFLAFLLRFDLFSAMYARLSTNILRTTINNPARAVLMGLFPPEHRALIRPFLRGTVVRVGILAGSGVIMLSEGLLHPRYLSVVGLVFMSVWVGTTIVFKRKYSQILLDLVSRNLLDIRSLEQADVTQIFNDKEIKGRLVESFRKAKGTSSLWYARLLRSLGVEELDSYILEVLPSQEEATKIELLGLISPDAGPAAVEGFRELLDAGTPDLNTAVLRAAARLPVNISKDFMHEVYTERRDPIIRAYALAGLYREDPETYREEVEQWLDSNDERERRAGIVAAGVSGDKTFLSRLHSLLEAGLPAEQVSLALQAMERLDEPELNEWASPYLAHEDPRVRRAALEAVRLDGDGAVRAVAPLLGDREPELQDLARERLQAADYQRPEILVEFLGQPNPGLRKNLFELLESLEMRDVEVMRFARGQLERAYRNAIEAEAVKGLSLSPHRDLLVDHLLQKKRERVDTVLRVLAAQDHTGRIRLIWRGVFSSDSRQRSNAVEALDDFVGKGLSRLMATLLENLSPDEIESRGRKEFKIPALEPGDGLCRHLLAKHDWVTVVLTLKLVEKGAFDGKASDVCSSFLQADNPHVRFVARQAAASIDTERPPREMDMESSISIPDKILLLRGIQIFEGLSVGEMAAIASVTEELVVPSGEDVIREGEQGETMYMVISGRVSVLKKGGSGEEIELDQISAGDYFGEMALFEDQVRSATIRTEEETRLLVLHKKEFEEIVREYPQIALHICKVLSHRLRKLHHRVQDYQKKQGEEEAGG